VFQPFRRLDDSRNQNIAGTGLGLAIARTIVRSHGGDIRISNRSEGGLRAELYLPVSEQISQLQASANSTAKTKSAAKILKGGNSPEISKNASAREMAESGTVNINQRTRPYGAVGFGSMAPVKTSAEFEQAQTSAGGGNAGVSMLGFSVFASVVASVKGLITTSEHYKRAGRKTGR